MGDLYLADHLGSLLACLLLLEQLLLAGDIASADGLCAFGEHVLAVGGVRSQPHHAKFLAKR